MKSLSHILKLLFCILLTCISPLAYADENRVLILGKIIPQFLDDPLNSPFGAFLHQLEKNSGLDFEIKLLPAKRATSLFARGDGDILIPFPVAEGDKSPFDQFEIPVLVSDPVAHLYRHILTLPPNPIISSPQELKGVRVGTALGYEYKLPQEILAQVDLFQASDQAALVKMLYRKRVQAIVSFPFEAQLIARKLGFSPVPHHSHDYILSRSDIVMLLQDSDRGIRLLGRINKALKILAANGEIDRLTQTFEEMPNKGS